VARILIVGGGCRGRRLAGAMVGEGHAVRVTTRTNDARPAIEAVGAECWIGTPNRLATLRGALDGVAVVCWLLVTASGLREEIRDLHCSRLESFLRQTIDTTVRGFVYEAPDTGRSATVDAEDVRGGTGTGIVYGEPEARPVNSADIVEGERIVRALTSRNAIPAAFVRADPGGDPDAWLDDVCAAIGSLLLGVDR
jgi:hypothetical protein